MVSRGEEGAGVDDREFPVIRATIVEVLEREPRTATHTLKVRDEFGFDFDLVVQEIGRDLRPRVLAALRPKVRAALSPEVGDTLSWALSSGKDVLVRERMILDFKGVDNGDNRALTGKFMSHSFWQQPK